MEDNMKLKAQNSLLNDTNQKYQEYFVKKEYERETKQVLISNAFNELEWSQKRFF